jgi:hypothetical protein
MSMGSWIPRPSIWGRRDESRLKLRAARFYVTHPNIVEALIAAIAAIGVTILAVLLKVALQY